MRRDVAESFAADIEQNELRECRPRLNLLKVLAAAACGQEREQLQREAENAEVESKQWSDLASLVRSLAVDPKKIFGHRMKTGT